MQVRPRIALLAGALGLAVTTAVAVTPYAADAAAPLGVTTIGVHGTLVVAQSDGPSGGSTSYAVALADGDLVPVRGQFSPDVRTGAAFDGRLALPASVTSALTAGAGVGDPTRAALRIVDRRSLTLSVIGTPSLTAPAAVPTPTVHQQFVAALDNRGALVQDDPTLLGHVSTVGGYWKSESNGAISSLVVPSTVTHYDTSVGTAACGLGADVNDFFNLVQEEMATFPGINPFGGSDQLVLFVPPACSSGSTVGRGTVGSSFASGGALIVKSGPGIEGVYGHETGHNYGFAHANALRAGTSLEYYGVYDVMGFTVGGGPGGLPFPMLNALSTPYRVFQGITDPGEIQDVDLGDQTQPVHATATIKPRTDGSGLRSVSVVDPDTGTRLYLDDRSGTGKDAGSVYASGNNALNSPSGLVRYAPGVVITAARAGSGVDDLVLDADGHTSLPAGGAWTNASGTLAVHVASIGAAGAAVSVDFTPPTQDFTTVGTPVIGGSVSVGGAVTLDTGSWSPAPTTTTIRWTAGGTPVANTDDQTSFVPTPALAGKQLVASVTGIHSGFRSATVQSAAVTVSPGTLSVTANPTVTGTVQVGTTLQGHTGTWSAALSAVSSTWQWRADGTDIPGATALTYTVQPGDVGKKLSLAQHLTATGYQATTIVSAATGAVPAPVISPAPTPTVSGTPRVGAPLIAQTGTWMSGVTLAYQWYAGGQPVVGATGPSYVPGVGDLGQTVRVEVTGTRTGYPGVTHASAETAAVAAGVLTTAKPTIAGTAAVGRTLKAKSGVWTPGTTFSYAWFADGVAIKHATAKKLVLTKARRGARITVKVTGSHAGYTSAARTSARTPRVS